MKYFLDFSIVILLFSIVLVHRWKQMQKKRNRRNESRGNVALASTKYYSTTKDAEKLVTGTSIDFISTLSTLLSRIYYIQPSILWILPHSILTLNA